MRSCDPKRKSLGNFLRVAAELWVRGAAGDASTLEKPCMKNHRSKNSCSARSRQVLYDSDNIPFFHFYDICDESHKSLKYAVADNSSENPVSNKEAINSPSGATPSNLSEMWNVDSEIKDRPFIPTKRQLDPSPYPINEDTT